MIEVGVWVKYIPENGIGKIIDIESVTGEVTIYWLDIENTSTEMSRHFDPDFDEFELLGHLTPEEELVLKLKYA